MHFLEDKRILFADDDSEIREALRLLLTCEGYETVEASNGKEVLEKMDHTIDLVILDVMMPEMNGYTVCAELRKRYTVPILFLTAKSLDSDKTMGFSAAGDAYYFLVTIISGLCAFCLFTFCFMTIINRKITYIRLLKKELDIFENILRIGNIQRWKK